jgi:ribose 5-phosphate isomerase B
LKIAIGNDHGGFAVKADIVQLLTSMGHEVIDHGSGSEESVDYPDYAKKVCQSVATGSADRGILICGTGIGMSMAANRSPTIRAALCHELYTAAMSREHNDANVLCLGARVVGPSLIHEIVRTWVTTEFAGGRHQKRVALFSQAI